MTFVLSLLTSSLGRTAAIAAVCFLAGVVVCWRWTHREPRLFSYTLPVASVENGATLSVKHGLLGRRTRLVMIEGLTAPGLNDPLGPDSQANLEGLAGDTVRIESHDRPIGSGTIVGTCYGLSNNDLGLAQLRAGLATCETAASREQLAAQKEAQKGRRGLWAEKDPGSRWWHFNVGASQLPEPAQEEQNTTETTKMFDLQTIGNIVLIAAAAIGLIWIVWHFAGSAVTAKAPTLGTAVSTAVDTSEQIAAYGALTLVRHTPAIANDPQATQYCDYLRTVCTAWPTKK